MNITILAYLYPRQPGGVETWLGEVAPRLSRENTLTLATWVDPGNVPLIEERYRLPVVNMAGLGRGYAPTPHALTRFVKILTHTDLVYYVISHVQVIRLVPILQTITRTPFIAGHHVGADTFSEHVIPFMKGASFYKLFAANHVLNKEHTAILTRLGYKKIYHISNGITLHAWQSKHPKSDGPFKILFVGRLVEQKGVDMLPAILHSLKNTIHDFEFHVGGDGPLRGLVSSLAEGGVAGWFGMGMCLRMRRGSSTPPPTCSWPPAEWRPSLSWVLRLWLLVRLWWRVIFLVRVSM
jgi:Glycosyltransferase